MKHTKISWLIAAMSLIGLALAAILFTACDDGSGSTPGNGNDPVISPCANGHTFTEWQETTPATCTAAAIDTEKCSVCGELGTVTDAGHSALGHSAGAVGGAIEVTCETDGYTGTGTCIHCLTNLSGTTIPATGHHYHAWTAPTCTTAGNNERECVNDCGTIDTRMEGYAALGHDWNWATYTIGSGIRNCQRGDCSGTVGIGDEGPAGGIIFYVASSGLTIQGYSGATGSFAEYTAYYLEAAPANETISIWQAWNHANNTLIDGITTWANTTERDTGLAGSIGVGRKDTQTIVNSTAFAALSGTAAQQCASKDLNGFKDWFLPSLGELNEFYKLKGQAGVPQTGIPTTEWLWSSSQGNDLNAWHQRFNNGLMGNSLKNDTGNRVRAVRAF